MALNCLFHVSRVQLLRRWLAAGAVLRGGSGSRGSGICNHSRPLRTASGAIQVSEAPALFPGLLCTLVRAARRWLLGVDRAWQLESSFVWFPLRPAERSATHVSLFFLAQAQGRPWHIRKANRMQTYRTPYVVLFGADTPELIGEDLRLCFPYP